MAIDFRNVVFYDNPINSTIRVAYFKNDNMTIDNSKTVTEAQFIIAKAEAADVIADHDQIRLWKIIETFKNSSSETIAIRTSYTDTKPSWIDANAFETMVG